MELELKTPITNIIGDLSVPTLENFNVLTGANGAGKSQLLRGIKQGSIVVQINNQSIDPNLITLITHNDINKPLEIKPCDYDTWRGHEEGYRGRFKRFSSLNIKDKKTLIDIAQNHNIKNVNCISLDLIQDLSLRQRYELYINRYKNLTDNSQTNQPRQAVMQLIHNILDPNKETVKFISDISDDMLDYSDDVQNLIINTRVMSARIETDTANGMPKKPVPEKARGDTIPVLNLLIYNYCKRYKDNRAHHAMHQQGTENHPEAITDAEFERKLPKPWLIINEFLGNIPDFTHRINEDFFGKFQPR